MQAEENFTWRRIQDPFIRGGLAAGSCNPIFTAHSANTTVLPGTVLHLEDTHTNKRTPALTEAVTVKGTLL